MKFLRHVIKLCFPDNYDDLFNHTDGRYATSPLALLDILDRLQYLVSGGSTHVYFFIIRSISSFSSFYSFSISSSSSYSFSSSSSSFFLFFSFFFPVLELDAD